MYQVGIIKEFIAQHYLIGGDWGHENSPHSHHFKLEMTLSAQQLDHHGYVADISVLERLLSQIIDNYRDRLLNDTPAFKGVNPSVENFCRILAQDILIDCNSKNLDTLKVTLWEDQTAWASYESKF